MKKRIMSATAILCAAAMMLNMPGAYGTSDEYNDKNYTTYGNLTEGSDIPSLFKNDDVFANYKDYPPVINDGVEYVPLELFYGLSGVKISYSDDNSNFYIQNKNTNQYISFNINDSYAVTGKNKVYETEVPSYYGVQYVPLRAVCDTVSIGCSTYNDGENKMYAIEIYTKDSTLSAQELLQIYAPEVYTPADTGTDNAPIQDPPPTSGTTQSPTDGYDGYSPDYGTPGPQMPDPVGPDMSLQEKAPYTSGIPSADTEDRYTETDNTANVQQPDDKPSSTDENKDKNDPGTKNNVEKPKPPEKRGGTVMLFYLPDHFDNAAKSLDALGQLGMKAVFFVTEENILDDPAMIRRIYTSGHTVGITFSEINDGLFAEGVLEQKTEAAENALYEVAKIKTRLLYLGEDGKNGIIPDSVRERAESMGLHTVAFNADPGTDKLDPKKSAASIRDNLRDIPESFGTDTVYLKLHHTDSAVTAIGAARGAARGNPHIHLELFDEAKKY